MPTTFNAARLSLQLKCLPAIQMNISSPLPLLVVIVRWVSETDVSPIPKRQICKQNKPLFSPCHVCCVIIIPGALRQLEQPPARLASPTGAWNRRQA